FQVYLTPYNLINYGLAIAVLGLVCSTAKLHTSAFRFGAIALTVVVTAPNHSEVWMTAATRFVDVAVGIVVALLVLLVWPRISET
ncbi:MAG: FUSC family protein, partial [Prochlorococcus sp.]